MSLPGSENLPCTTDPTWKHPDVMWLCYVTKGSGIWVGFQVLNRQGLGGAKCEPLLPWTSLGNPVRRTAPPQSIKSGCSATSWGTGMQDKKHGEQKPDKHI
jgi:hypothetical protein